jgi:hypothetical protein
MQYGEKYRELRETKPESLYGVSERTVTLWQHTCFGHHRQESLIVQEKECANLRSHFQKGEVLGEQAMLMSDILQFYFSCLALDSSPMNHALLAKCRVIKWLMQCPCNPITEKTPMTHIVIVKNQ